LDGTDMAFELWGVASPTSCASGGYIPSNCTCYRVGTSAYLPSSPDLSGWSCAYI
jgi:hypothetical protein